MRTINHSIKFLQTNWKLLFRSYCHFDIHFATIKYSRVLKLYLSETSSLSDINSHWFFLPLSLVGGFSSGWQLAFQKAKKAWKYLLGYLTRSPTCQIWEIVFFFSFCMLQCYAVSQYGGSEFQRLLSTHYKVDNAESLVPMAAIMCDWKEMLNVFLHGAHPILLWWRFLRQPSIVGLLFEVHKPFRCFNWWFSVQLHKPVV